MVNKPAPKNWNDIQVAIATVSMAFTLVFWNLFAGPDRETALKTAQAQTGQQPQQPIPQIVAQPTRMSGPILLGGSAPQTVIIQSSGRSGGGGGGTGGS